MRKSAIVGADPQGMALLREKLNQIAVGRRHLGDNQVDHMDDSGDEDEFGDSTTSSARRRRPAPGSGHFRVFLPVGERPSTPPSSPQPRDVLRKHLRLKSHAPYRSHCSADNNSDTASDEPLDGMCVDTIEISPLPHGADHNGLPTHPTVRLSVPDHLRVRTASSSSYSVLTKCPEGFRKRKSVHIDDKDLIIDGHSVVAPLKKVSSQINVLGAAASSVSSSTASPSPPVMCDQEMEDVELDPSDSPPRNRSSCS
jgi:hypothetical protein